MKRILTSLLFLVGIVLHAQQPIVPPADLQTQPMVARVTSAMYAFTQNTPVEVGVDGQDIYILGLCLDYPDAWLKGTLEGSTVVFPQRQFLYLNEGYDEDFQQEYSYTIYAYGLESDQQTVSDFTMSYNAETGEMELTSPYLAEMADYEGYLFASDIYSDIVISPLEEQHADPVVMPEGLKALPYTLSATEWMQGPLEYDVRLAFDGDTAYFGDFCVTARETGHCIKGQRQGNQIIFPAEQYLDTDYEADPLINLYCYGADFDGATMTTGDIVMDYDPATDTYTLQSGIVISVGKLNTSTMSFVEFLSGVTLTGQDTGIQPAEYSCKGKVEGLFDLQGRQLSPFKEKRGEGLPSGLYVVSGRKVLVK